MALLPTLICTWVAATLAACGSETTQPTPIEGTFVLQTLNEATLPYDHEGLGCCTYLGGGLQLGQGRYAVSITARNRNTQLVFTATEWGRYSQQASALGFVRDSFALFPFLLDSGTAAADGIRIPFGGEGPGSPDQFRALFVRSP
jgi:hypothetical protein